MTVDAAEVFLEALGQAVERDRLLANTPRNARVFVNPVSGFLTYPVGVGELARWVRTRRHGPRHDLARDEIGQAPRSDAWETVPALNGLLVRADRLPWHDPVQSFGGTINLKMAAMKRENGNDEHTQPNTDTGRKP